MRLRTAVRFVVLAVLLSSCVRAEDGAGAGRRRRRSFPTSSMPPVPAGARRHAGGRGTTTAAGASCRPATCETAEREFAAALRRRRRSIRPRRRSATSSWRARTPRRRCTHFDRALERQSGLRVGARRPGPGARWRSTATTKRSPRSRRRSPLDPSLTDLPRRVEVLRFRGARARARARARRRRGRTARRGGAGVSRPRSPSSPDSAFLYRELAGVERQQGDADAALEHFRKARRRSIRPTPASLAQIGELLEARGDFDGALEGVRRRARDRAERGGRGAARRRCARASSWRGCRPSTARSTQRRRSRAAISRRSSASGSRALLRARAARDAGVDHRRARPLGASAGSWRSRAPASWSRSRTTRSSRARVVRRVDLAQAVEPAARRGSRAAAAGAADVGRPRGGRSPTCRRATWRIRRRRRRSRPA